MTKKQQLIALPGAKAGADIPTLSKKLGWQLHTTRASLSGLRKAGFELVKIAAAQGRPTRYHIASTPAPSDAVSPDVKAAANAGQTTS